MVKKVIDTIPNDEIGMRDKALISFLLASGGRNSAVASLPIECFNLANLEVDFNAAKGVRMKFGKSYLSYLFIFDSELIEHIKNWHKYLLKDKLYSPQSPYSHKLMLNTIKELNLLLQQVLNQNFGNQIVLLKMS